MSTSRGSLPVGLLQAGVAMATGWITLLTWSGFATQSSDYLLPLFVGALLIGASGALLRWGRTPGIVVVLAQLALAVAYVNIAVVGSPIPWGARWQELVDTLRAATQTSQLYAAPVPPQAGSLMPLMLPLGLALLLLVDLFAGTLRRVPLAGLPLLTIYSIPVSLLPDGIHWWLFVLVAGGFLTMIYLHEDEQVTRWGRSLGRGDGGLDPAGFGVRTGAIKGTAVGIGAVATAAALVLPAAIPTLELGLFSGGTGAGKGDVHVENPMTDLRRDLQRGRDVPLLRITTNDPSPSYLRLAALTRFTDNEWSSGDRKIPSDQTANGQPLPLDGISPTVERTVYEYQIAASAGFDSIWLPTMTPATSVQAPGDWRYDSSTLDFLAADDDTNTEGVDYRTTAGKVSYDPRALADAPAAGSTLQAAYTALPEGIPFVVRQTADQITADAPTKFQKATALQQWFREDGGFTYDLSVRPGNGTDELVQFLDEKVGYCEQFASAMAVMARMEGLPARVAVGFLRPERVGASTWEFSSHDLHAWVEIYFPGSGWVLFDPTPGGRTGDPPAYTTADLPAVPDQPSSSAPTGRAQEDLPSRAATPSADQGADATDGAGAGAGGAILRGVLIALGIIVLLALVVVTPRLVRRLRSDRRWATWPGPEAAWAELGDTMVDLGRTWPAGLSPRAASVHLVHAFGQPLDEFTPDRPAHGPGRAPQAELALDRVLESLELLRYAAPGTPHTEALHAEVATCVAALYGGATVSARRRARWLPRSVLRRPARPLPPESVEVVERGELVDHVG
ncbi:MAG: DUF3488 and transglutaminase-like domain-containing protein [Nocardioidaceae bacterium]